MLEAISYNASKITTFDLMQEYLYYAYYKPFGVLSQFSDEGNHPGLKRFLTLRTDVYPVGRLDRDSEGLLLLTNDPRVNGLLLAPERRHWRTYYVQVEGEATDGQMQHLQNPMTIKVKQSSYQTLPCRAELLPDAPTLPDRDPPIRYRASIPTSWISVSVREGKNRQVRKMTAQVGLPTLRLVRFGIESLTVEGMAAGELRPYDREKFYRLLNLI